MCAGINNLTYKQYNYGGIEVVPHTIQFVIQGLVHLKEKISRYYPKSVVGIATIPILDFKHYQRHCIKYHHLIPSYNEDALSSMQHFLSNELAWINPDLVHQTREYQIVQGIGYIKPPQLYLHQDVEKVTYRRNRREVRIKRIPEGRLYDGLHPTDFITEHWHMAIHNSFKKVICEVRNILTL